MKKRMSLLFSTSIIVLSLLIISASAGPMAGSYIPTLNVKELLPNQPPDTAGLGLNPIPVEVRIKPETINLKSNHKVTIFLVFPEDDKSLKV